MSRYAQDDQVFKDVIYCLVVEKLNSHTYEEITAASFTKDQIAMIHGTFQNCMGEGDISEISLDPEHYTDDDHVYEYKKWRDSCVELALDKQIEIAKSDLDLGSDREQTTDDIGAGA